MRSDADLAVDTLDLHLHLLAQILVERAQRLVEQEDVGIEHEAARQCDALLLAARQFARIAGYAWPCNATASISILNP
jgi:hypothetical protein